MATSSAAVGAAALAIGIAGCGGSGHTSSSGSVGSTSTGTSTSIVASSAPGNPAFAWLRPQPAPPSWPVGRIPNDAEMAYPPSWRKIKTDAGTVTAALRTPSGRYIGYLNATPEQGAETLANWRTFRIAHNKEEGDRVVTRLAYAAGLKFLDGRGNCVKDAYVSGTGVRYIEIACLVAGPRARTVIVGAGPPSAWAQVSSPIERAISGFRT